MPNASVASADWASIERVTRVLRQRRGGAQQGALELRLASAAVAIPIIVLLVWAGARWYTGVVAALLAVATLEFQVARGSRLNLLALMAASRHPGVAITIASASFPERKPLIAAMVLYLLVNVILYLPYRAWCRRHQTGGGERRPDRDSGMSADDGPGD